MPVVGMANPPEHDFAPSWLKIPAVQQQPKQSVDCQHSRNARGDGFHSSSASRLRLLSTDNYSVYNGPTVQGSYSNRNREDKSFSHSRARHHSVEDLSPTGDYRSSGHNFNQLNGTSHHGAYHQPGGVRRQPPRDSSYSSGGRHTTNRDTPFSNSSYNSGRTTTRQRYHSGQRSDYLENVPDEKRKDEEDKGRKDNEEIETKDIPDPSALSSQDFPSLSGVGTDGREKNSGYQTLAGAWEKPPSATKLIGNRKLQLIHKSSRELNAIHSKAPSPNINGTEGPKLTVSIINQTIKNSNSVSTSSNIYKSLVPTKAQQTTKNSSRKIFLKESTAKTVGPNIIMKEKVNTTTIPTSNTTTKEITWQNSILPMEILSPRVVLSKAKKIDKKSDFLKELRKAGTVDSKDEDRDVIENKDVLLNHNGTHSYTDTISLSNNSIHNQTLTNGDIPRDLYSDLLPPSTELSSSLEAEKRLLHQMGWHEHSDNEEEYAPITEDEMREFQQLSQQIKKNGISRNVTIWKQTPIQIQPYPDVKHKVDTCYSSDSSSDDDGDVDSNL